MTQESTLTLEIRQAIGRESVPFVIEIDKTMISRFAEAIQDKNPLWCDETKARAGRYGTLVAPPSLLCGVLAVGQAPTAHIEHLLPQRRLDGGGEWEFFLPLRLGDTLTGVNKLVDIVEKPGRHGPMLIMTFEITWRNQRLELVAQARITGIRY